MKGKERIRKRIEYTADERKPTLYSKEVRM